VAIRSRSYSIPILKCCSCEVEFSGNLFSSKRSPTTTPISQVLTKVNYAMDFTRSYFAADRYSAKKMSKPVNFICLAPDAKQVNLTGDFNDWDAAAHPMKRQPDGAVEPWAPSLSVPGGREACARPARPRHCPRSQRGEGVVDRGELGEGEIRNPKPEIRKKSESRTRTTKQRHFRLSVFGFRPSDFFRISDFDSVAKPPLFNFLIWGRRHANEASGFRFEAAPFRSP